MNANVYMHMPTRSTHQILHAISHINTHKHQQTTLKHTCTHTYMNTYVFALAYRYMQHTHTQICIYN